VPLSEERAARRRDYRLIAWFAAAAVIILVVVGVTLYHQGQNNGLARARADSVEALFQPGRLGEQRTG
jgi:hypothetical protein